MSFFPLLYTSFFSVSGYTPEVILDWSRCIFQSRWSKSNDDTHAYSKLTHTSLFLICMWTAPSSNLTSHLYPSPGDHWWLRWRYTCNESYPTPSKVCLFRSTVWLSSTSREKKNVVTNILCTVWTSMYMYTHKVCFLSLPLSSTSHVF